MISADIRECPPTAHVEIVKHVLDMLISFVEIDSLNMLWFYTWKIPFKWFLALVAFFVKYETIILMVYDKIK